MKVAMKLVAILLSLIILFSLGAVGCSGGEKIDETVSYKPLSGSNASWLFDNPDRGYRGEWYMAFQKNKESAVGAETWNTIYVDDGFEANKEKIDWIYGIYRPGSMSATTKLMLWQMNMSGYNKDDVLPDELLQLFEYCFEICRKDNIKLLARFSYGAGVDLSISNPEHRVELEKLCADEEHMIMHTKQLGEFLKDHTDVIHKITSGFIGNGEMVAGFQWPPVDFNNVIKAILENICVPNDLYFTVRSPKYKVDLLEAEPDYEYLKLIGFNNDGIFGEQENYGWTSGCYQYNHNFDVTGPGQCYEADNGGTHIKNDWWNYICETAAYTPQSGEMFVNSHLVGMNRVPSGLQVILQMAHHRYTTLSHWHTLFESKGQDNVMQRWVDNEQITSDILDENGIIYDPNWFYDKDGNLLDRNPYEFLRDHLGYKVEAQNATFKGTLGKGKSLNIDLKLKNYGFAAAFCLTSGFAVLNEDYEVVSTVEAGDPEKWYSHDPDNWQSTEILVHTVNADITLPKESGKYYIGFYLKNTMEDYACLSNDGEFENGYNILYEFEI